MADQITLTLPADISARVREIAETTRRPVEQIVVEYLQHLTLTLPELPPDEQAELEALRHLSDDALWTIAREQVPEELQARARYLMEANASGRLSEAEASELERLVVRADRLMLRKAEAASLLRARGHTFKQEDFRQPHE